MGVQLAFVLPPPAGFGWSQSFAGSVFGSATLCAGALTFAAGVFVDRLGSRLSLLLTGGSLSLACLLASVAESSPALWVAFCSSLPHAPHCAAEPAALQPRSAHVPPLASSSDPSAIAGSTDTQ